MLRTLIEDGLVRKPGGHPRQARAAPVPDRAGAALERELSDAQRDRMRAAYRAAGPEAVAGFRQVLEAMMDAEMRRHYRALRDERRDERRCRGPHLLIVDDDERIRGLLQKFLMRHGFW